MLEYTLFVFFALIFALILDLWILKTKLIRKPRFWIFLFLVVMLQTVVDNWLNGRWWFGDYIVGEYSSYSGIKIWHTPLENYLFGIGLVWMCIAVFEFLDSK
jgi:lycopene cyclase domain-containing protein